MLPDHSGQTAVIIGNGLSLRTVPREFLDAYPTFGCNYICDFPYQPTYYTCIDSRVLTDNAAKIHDVAAGAKLAFISTYPPPNPDLDRLRALPNVVPVGRFTFVFNGEWYMSGNTATYVALKLAFFMGFARVMLVGVDHDAGWKHFSDSYPAAQGTNFEGQRHHYRLANLIYSEHGREIINLSPRSALDAIFRRDSLKNVIENDFHFHIDTENN